MQLGVDMPVPQVLHLGGICIFVCSCLFCQALVCTSSLKVSEHASPRPRSDNDNKRDAAVPGPNDNSLFLLHQSLQHLV